MSDTAFDTTTNGVRAATDTRVDRRRSAGSTATAQARSGNGTPWRTEGESAVHAASTPPGHGEAVRLLTGLTDEPRPASAARHFVTATLDAWRFPADRGFPVELAVSELVANAVEHGRGATRMAVSRTSTGVRVEVSDRSTGTPAVMHPGAMEEGHRGLLIIDSVSSRWGFELTRVGKTVWAEFDYAA